MTHIQVKPYVHQFTAPAVLIGCGTATHPNLITCSWFGVVASEPPQVAVGIRPGRFSHHLVEESGEFSVIVPTADQLEIVKQCGSLSGRDGDKLERLGLSAAPCPPLEQAPMIEEAEIALACRVKHQLELGSHTLYIGEVVAVHGREENIRPSGRLDPHPASQIAYLDGRYWSLAPLGG